MFIGKIYNDNSVYDYEEWLKRRKLDLDGKIVKQKGVC